ARELVTEHEPPPIPGNQLCMLRGAKNGRVEAEVLPGAFDGGEVAAVGERGDQQRPARVRGQRLDPAEVCPLRRGWQRALEPRAPATLLGCESAGDLDDGQ